MAATKNLFAFKPEIEENVIITHPDLIGEAEHNFKLRKEKFDKKYSDQILVSKIIHLSTYEVKLKKKRQQILKEEEEAAALLKNISTHNWLTNDEERRLFVEHYVQEIRLEVEKKERCKQWVQEHF